MKIVFLIHNAFGIGGTIRSTANLSGALAARHQVEVVSVHRVADTPRLPLDPRVRLTSLLDVREGAPDADPPPEPGNTMFPDAGVDFGTLRYTARHDRRIAAFLQRTDADVVIATRPILNGYLARHGRRRALRIGQEHLSLDAHGDRLQRDQNAAIRALDAFVTVSEADAAQYRAALPGAATEIRCVPNGVPAPGTEPASLDSQVVVAAGRLVHVKRYDRLIRAFGMLAEDHPEWTLRLYGRGPERARLREQIDRSGLYDRVSLRGAVAPIETEWAKGSVAAVCSDMESFGMTIVEAMHCGVPVVATDCPHGPSEIIGHGRDGLLVPLDGTEQEITAAYARALGSLMSDEPRRRRLGDAARARAAAYAPEACARAYEDLFAALRTARGGAGGPGLLGRVRAALRPPAARTGPRRAAAAPEDPPAPVPPLAFARATSEGGVQVRFEAPDLPPGEFDFVARLRRDPEHREIRTPLRPPGAFEPRQVGVTLKQGEHLLAEGRWDCYLAEHGTGRRVRLVSGLTEQARLLGRPPVLDAQGVSAWIPYTTEDGYLALRTWRRPAHAEVGRLRVGEDAARLTAHLLTLAEVPLDGARVRAASRAGAEHDFTVPVEPLGEDVFRCVLPYRAALARRAVAHDVWDLALETAADAGPIPLGRITGDGVDRKRTDVFPVRLHPHPVRGTTRVKPFFTVRNDLALSARDLDPE
ncbi:glycosyltransferase [Streptomyces physcomitrii]|uniref:glycosyltransferase n=1 Tax=Streptomyces physcomitrii TaxID=2724184 RepID=UPI00343142D0